jgi:general secretion pathway protein E
MNIIDIVSQIINKAIADNGSDIHFEPMSSGMRVRMRRDGALSSLQELDKEHVQQVVNRLKVMAGMDIAVTRLPQDGKHPWRAPGSDESSIDLRFSTLPTIRGEKVEVRILNKSTGALTLETIALPELIRARLLAALGKAYGLFLVVGPTGSGKTTTLYSLLQYLNSPRKNIITIEDPVEYQLPGINQVQVNPRTGLTFASGLRTILRQDPDIILVGELRDLETAEIAFRAALTGHLVLATLHTRDTLEAVIRLQDMGISSFTLSSALRGVLAQRLIPLLCTDCQGRGGECCGRSGYKGRRALFEYLGVESKIQETIHKTVSYNQLAAAVHNESYRSFRTSAEEMLAAGITTREQLSEFLA